ncbi:hypothetical protein [Streptococcus fryi]
MTYELSLEYGSYPVKEREGFLESRKVAPDFLNDNPELVKKIDDMNTLFHELFLTIECTFHYIGSQYPDKITKLHQMYDHIANELVNHYPEQDIHIEYFILS